MIAQIVEKIVNLAIERERFPIDEKEIYVYGYTVLIEMTLCTICTLIVGILFEVFCELVLYLGVFIVLRVFGGGYHAKKTISCIGLSILIVVLFCDVINTKLIVENSYLLFIGVGGSIIMLSKFHSMIASKDNEIEKKCTRITKKVYKMFYLASIILYCSGLNRYATCILLAQISWFLSMKINSTTVQSGYSL